MSKLLDYTGLGRFLDKLKVLFIQKQPTATLGNITVFNGEGSIIDGGKSIALTLAVFFGTIDSTSTAAELTATVDGLTEIVPGTTVYIYNGVISGSSSGTLNINNLGALPIYRGGNESSRVGFSKNHTWQLIYNPVRVTGGCWDMQYGQYSYVNLGYYDRESSYSLIAKEEMKKPTYVFHYSETELVPLYNGTSLTTLDFDPFSKIYWMTSSNHAANTSIAATDLYTRTNSGDLRSWVSEFTPHKLFFIKCVPLVDSNNKRTGRVLLAPQPFALELPTTEDGFVYILMGMIGSNLYNLEFLTTHPIFEFRNGALRLWTNQEEYLALTSEEIDSDIIEIVEFKDPIFKLTLIERWNKEIPSINGEFPKVALDTLTTVPSGFMSSTNITSIEDLKNFTSLTSLSSGEFNGCQYLTSITIPDNIQSIGYGVFAGSSVSSVTFGSNLEVINNSAFTLCLFLTTLSFPSSLKTLDLGAFANCTNLTSVTLNEGLLTIGSGTFNNTGITSIVIPSTVTNIYPSALSTSTVIVDFGNTRTSIVPYSSPWESGVLNLTAVIVPDNLVNDWKSTTGWSSIASYIVGYSEYHNN